MDDRLRLQDRMRSMDDVRLFQKFLSFHKAIIDEEQLLFHIVV